MSQIVTIAVFDNAFEANISKGKLDSEEIWCTLKDENIVNLNWFYNNAMGGIKLCVNQEDAPEALEVLDISSKTEEISCPNCHSKNVKVQHAKSIFIGIIKLTVTFFLIFF